MTENVQCPVCTLYLHAGMNLSDHLETHPKEQVIRALVQMTISSASGVGQSNAPLTPILGGETSSTANETKKSNSVKEEKPLSSNLKDKDLNAGSNVQSCSGSTTNNSTSNCSSLKHNGSKNSDDILNYSTANSEGHNEIEHLSKDHSPPSLPTKASVKAETNSIVKDHSVGNNENVNECFTKNTFGLSNASSNSTTITTHSYHQAPIELTNSNSIHSSFSVFSGNQRYDHQQQRNSTNNQNQVHTTPRMPPPPPPPTSQSQHQDINRGILPSGPSGTFHSIQAQQLTHPPLPPHHLNTTPSSSNHRQQQMFVGQHQTSPNSQHQQNLKVIYAPTLPPPPPLQLFTYQPPTHLQHHQKPPPAYGTAISQIRSQNNQNKHQVTGSSAVHQQHQTLQAHIALQQQQQQAQNLHQQQNVHHNVRIHVPPSPPPIPTPVKLSYSSKNQELPAQHHAATVRHNHQQLHQHQQQHQPQPHQNKTVLSQQQQQQQPQPQAQHQQQNNNENIQNSKNHIINSNEILNKSTKSGSSTSAGAGTSASTANNANASSHPHVSISPSTASASMAAVAASTLGRHTNSPFAALLAAAAGAPSPSTSSSVLRYAESPVAHYLERENGDFIVQETPKHIVECVETDNGEFSVIERIYQSPPSVLHIHDDEDDDDDDSGREQMESSVHNESTDIKSKKQDVSQDSDNEKMKQNTEENHKKIKNSSNGNCKKSNHSDPHQSDANEIVDFVSISSDSGDEEEFISQDGKDHSTTETSAKIQPSTTPSSTSQTTLSLLPSSSSSYSVATASGSDDQSSPSTSNSIPSNSLHSPSTVHTAQTQQNSTASPSNGTTVRKKSSKNTITVLSDVQLNLNEYLDLVGNIIASSKVAAQRKTLASIAPMPLVKIEKEEPIDEYITTYPSTANTNFEIVPPPPLKANKHETEETTDNHSSSSSSYIETNNHNISLINEIKQDEKDEKKPQVLENINANETVLSSFATSSNASTSSTTINSSHVTSVIRMASTSQHQAQQQQQQHTQQLQSLENNKNSNEAEDLSQPQSKVQPMTNAKSMSQPSSLARKGPKKLVIKPKSSKTEVLPRENKSHQNKNDNDQQLPTTSAMAKQESIKHITDDANVQVKNEPIASIAYENQQQNHQPFQSTAGFSILEQHLNSKEPILDFKEEKPCLTEASVPATTIIKEMKVENNVNDDARVLYDFANSKKSQNESPSVVFPSSMSVFSNIQTSTENTNANANANGVQQKSKLINQEMDNSSSSSTYSSQSAMDVTIPSEGLNESNTTTTTNTSTANGQSHQQTHQIFTDFPFSYLYNNMAGANEQIDVKNLQQFATFYQNDSNGNNSSGNINNNNNSSALLLEDSSSTKHYNEYEQQHHLNHNQIPEHQQQPSTSHQPWFNNTNYAASEHNVASVSTNHSTANINSLSVDGSAALDSTEVGKYLDLDACKREQNIDVTVGERVTVPPPPPPSSSTSCSFNGATDNSMAGICSTGATLNIRTDEKMPAKGEISEQESNCDIDNSWSQPMYGDISARFFKTTFPGIFPQDNGWNHDEYFTVHDLSASTTAQATNSNIRSKSFEPNNSTNNSCSMPIFSQNTNDNCNMDVMPSTSAKIRKRRKRSSQDNKTLQENAKRMHPTSTVTSQQILMQNPNDMPNVEFNFHQQQQQQIQLQQQPHLQQPSTSTAFLAGPSNAANTSLTSNFMIPQQQQQPPHQAQNQIQQKQRTKVYECGHCNAKYSKLKDRNAHMVDAHNYVRQNRRLICPTTGLATPVTNTDVQDVAVPTTSAASGNLMASIQPNTDCMGDYKQSIVKIENENINRELNCVEPISANLSAKTEIMEDNKQQLALIPLNTENSINNNLECDRKPSTNGLPLSLTTSTSKLTTLYRMLVSFNMTTLKQNQSLTEFDENLIKSSIFFCYVCRQNFNSVKFYDAHLTEHPAECFTCGKKFQRWKNFSLHLKRHLGWKEFGCTVCDKKFVVRSALVEHTRMHSGLSPLKCKVCGKHFKRYSNLTQHRKRHTKQIVRRKEYVCYCGEVLPSKARFLWHKETHDSKPKCCPHCCDRFVHVNSLRRHIRLAHSDKFDYTEPMECPICKQIFAKASMKAHMATHSTETQYDCAICSKSFSTKWNLKIHSWVHANRTAKPFKCEHCPKAFVREVDFKNHMNSHKQIKPYTCEVCGCKFIRKYNYMRHRREHHGNKKYTCDLCKKSFHRHYYLIEHRRIHTGERPFQCTICGKSSTTKTNHNKHLKIHHSRDPFTVEV